MFWPINDFYVLKRAKGSAVRAWPVIGICLLLAASFARPGITAETLVLIPNRPDPDPVSMVIEDAPLASALAALGERTGVAIELHGEVGDARTSLTLREASLEKSIERILSPLNYIVVWNLDGSVSVLLLDELAKQPAPGDAAEEATAAVEGDSPLHIIGDTEVVPPGEDGEEGLTEEDLDYYQSLSRPTDSSEIDLLPPGAQDAWGMTAQDLELENDLSGDQSIYQELLPPGPGAEVPFTVGDLEAQEAQRIPPLPSEIEVIPPGPSGEPGMTLEELEQIIAARPQPDPSQVPLSDLIPPE